MTLTGLQKESRGKINRGTAKSNPRILPEVLEKITTNLTHDTLYITESPAVYLPNKIQKRYCLLSIAW